MKSETAPRYDHEQILNFSFDLLTSAGMAGLKAVDVADVLVEGDLLGRTTHGLQLLPAYLQAISEGAMACDGDYEVVSDQSAALVWDGRRLPGPWLVKRAVTEAERRLERYPTVTIVIRHSHHIAALQAYLRPVADKGLVMLLASSDPANKSVAPHGATEPVFTPNPLAIGFPTDGDPVLIDMSASSTAYGQCARAARENRRLPGTWLVDGDGRPTDDPGPLVAGEGGAIMSLGGADLGYKGFGLGLAIEALTMALGGHGRADGEAQWGASVFLQLINPSRFGGLEAFQRETGFLAQACRAAAVPVGAEAVRLPGERALARRTEQLAHGVQLHPEIMPALLPWAEKLKKTAPEPLP